jgi:hypothetical protein
MGIGKGRAVTEKLRHHMKILGDLSCGGSGCGKAQCAVGKPDRQGFAFLFSKRFRLGKCRVQLH